MCYMQVNLRPPPLSTMRTPPNHLQTTSDHQLSSRHLPDKILSQITQIVKMPIAALQNDRQNGHNNGQNGQNNEQMVRMVSPRRLYILEFT